MRCVCRFFVCFYFQYLNICLWQVLVLARRLSYPAACGIFIPQLGTELTSPALKGGFLTTGPPGKSCICFIHECESEVKAAQLCLTLPSMDCTVRGILQARILEWVAFPFSRGSSQPRDWTQVSCITGGFFTSWATREAHSHAHTFICVLWIYT